MGLIYVNRAWAWFGSLDFEFSLQCSLQRLLLSC